MKSTRTTKGSFQASEQGTYTWPPPAYVLNTFVAAAHDHQDSNNNNAFSLCLNEELKHPQRCLLEISQKVSKPEPKSSYPSDEWMDE